MYVRVYECVCMCVCMYACTHAWYFSLQYSCYKLRAIEKIYMRVAYILCTHIDNSHILPHMIHPCIHSYDDTFMHASYTQTSLMHARALILTQGAPKVFSVGETDHNLGRS